MALKPTMSQKITVTSLCSLAFTLAPRRLRKVLCRRSEFAAAPSPSPPPPPETPGLPYKIDDRRRGFSI